jgi:hypothetical protein
MSATLMGHQSGRWFCPSGLSLGWNVQPVDCVCRVTGSGAWSEGALLEDLYLCLAGFCSSRYRRCGCSLSQLCRPQPVGMCVPVGLLCFHVHKSCDVQTVRAWCLVVCLAVALTQPGIQSPARRLTVSAHLLLVSFCVFSKMLVELVPLFIASCVVSAGAYTPLTSGAECGSFRVTCTRRPSRACVV